MKKSQAKQLADFRLVESDHRLTVNDRHRRALKPLVEQFLQRRFIGADIFLYELDPFLR